VINDVVKPQNQYYDTFPRIVPADKETEITIRPLFDHCKFDSQTRYQLTYYPTEEFAQKSGWPEKNHPKVRLDNGDLRFTQYFEAEQEHVILIHSLTEKEPKLITEFRFYSLQPDLFKRYPYKGDVHIHTYHSDGRESPGYVAAIYRRAGFDFIAIADHGKYAPSIEAQEVFKGLDIDLGIFPGEEVHPPDNPVHMVNCGGKFSVNDIMRNEESTYRAEVKTIQDKLIDLPPGVDPYQYASCRWCFDKIREAKGLGIFCHPYWFAGHRYTPSGAITSLLLKEQPYDVYELIGGYGRLEPESNPLQVARYHEERAQGRQIAIVGVSDSHGCERTELFNWFYTIAFAASPELDDIISSVKDLYSVAVEALPNELARPFGPFRLVKYALFLIREIMPQHHELCVEEGRLMREYLAGDKSAAQQLKKLKGRTTVLLRHYWGM